MPTQFTLSMPEDEGVDGLALEEQRTLYMPELALRFILSNPDVTTIIPGMRKLSHVQSNIAASDEGALTRELLAKLRQFRWVRKPAPWSD